MPDTVSVASRYSDLEAVRQTVLDRAREAAKLTIPSLMPPAGHGQTNTLPTPYQGVGAMGVNNLASKLLLAMLPPNTPFFRMTIDDFTLTSIGNDEARAEFEEALGTIERSIMSDMEARALRTALFVANRQLIVAGNVLLYVPEKGKARVFTLDKYVVKRDPAGNVLEIIVKETLSKASLDPELLALVEDNKSEDSDKPRDAQKTVELFTYIYKQGNRWFIRQEIAGKTVPDSEGEYPEGKLPWLALRWTRIDGEDYGRGLVEEYYGDLKSLEGLTKAIVQGSAAAAKVLFMVRPNSTTKKSTLAKAENGDIITGDANDVSALQLNKFADFQITLRTAEQITERLSMAFLLNTTVQRDAERVTAAEIRYVAGQLEDSLGGLYSLLSQELQLPLVRIIMSQMEAAGKLPSLPQDDIKPVIVTGLEALGRGQDLQKLELFLQGIQQLGPEGQQYLNVPDWLTRFGTALAIDMDGLVKTQEQIKQEQAQAMMQQVLQNPEMMSQLQAGLAQQPQQEGT
jgi:hypothetical protein